MLTPLVVFEVMKKEDYTAPSIETILLSSHDNYCGLVLSPGGSGSDGGSGSGSSGGRNDPFLG